MAAASTATAAASLMPESALASEHPGTSGPVDAQALVQRRDACEPPRVMTRAHHLATGSLETALAQGEGLLADAPGAAAEQAREILAVTPGSSAGHRLLARALRLVGRGRRKRKGGPPPPRGASHCSPPRPKRWSPGVGWKRKPLSAGASGKVLRMPRRSRCSPKSRPRSALMA